MLNGARPYCQRQVFEMILIDFVPGSHGNFLETVLNGIYYNTRFDSFNELGTSHKKPYDLFFGKFYSDHFSFCVEPMEKFDINDFESVIRITYDYTDLALIQFLAYTRVGDAGLDFNDIENLISIFTQTFIDLRDNKLSHPVYKQFTELLTKWLEAGNGVFDKNACREMLKFSFSKKNQLLQNRWVYPNQINVVTFPFKAFYDKSVFLDNLQRIITELGLKQQIPSFVIDQYEKFINLNKAKYITVLPEKYYQELKKNNHVEITGMNIYQEAYLDHLYECHYCIEALFYHQDGKYFSNTSEILEYINQSKLDG